MLGGQRRLRHTARPAIAPRGRLEFTLDARRRWTLSYHGGGPPVPLIADAELAVHVEDTFVTLGALDDVTAGPRTDLDREAVVVSGTTAGIAVEVAFVGGAAAGTPSAAITVSLSPDRVRGIVRGIRYGAVPEQDILPGAGRLLALINGYHSWSESLVVAVPGEATALASHAATGFTRAGRGLALAFDRGEPGEAAVHLTGDVVEARTDWLPPRPLRPEGDAATLRFAFDPTGDGQSALAGLFAPVPADLDRFALAAPAGWSSWSELHDRVAEADVIANLEFCATHFDRRFLRTIQIDDGYQKAAGDWDTNEKFPHGHRWLSDQIHARGFQAGLWIAPFAVTTRSGIPTAHPDWLLQRDGAPLVLGDNARWGGPVYGLDGAHPEVWAWLADLARRVVRDWGYDYLKIDFLLYATAGDAHAGGATHAEAYRAGLAAIRDGLGTEAFLLGCGAPLQHAVGAVNGMRIGGDVDASWGGIQGPARAAARRRYYHRATWYNDPDCLVVRAPLTPAEARVWTSLIALSGGITVFSDDLPKLSPDRVALLQRAIPAAPVTGRGVDLGPASPEIAPAIVIEDSDVVPLSGPWKFRTGDDPAYAARHYDEDGWETTPLRTAWEEAGHLAYDGYAWYRTRFTLPLPSPEQTGGRLDLAVALELGRIDDVDATFVNGIQVGQRGDFPPSYRSEWQTFRRYPVPADALSWGAENVVAIRVYDGGGRGGLWNVRRDPPPPCWVVEGAPRWWTVALVNWDDEPRDLSLSLGSLGVNGGPWHAYDVWADVPLSDTTERLSTSLPPHAVWVVALRATVARPQIIGTTRHVVQGAVDIASETWDAAKRTLRGTSVNLDARRYGMTLAVPPGLRVDTCKAELRCTVNTLPSGQVVIEWPDGSAGRDIEWEVSFLKSPRR